MAAPRSLLSANRHHSNRDEGAGTKNQGDDEDRDTQPTRIECSTDATEEQNGGEENGQQNVSVRVLAGMLRGLVVACSNFALSFCLLQIRLQVFGQRERVSWRGRIVEGVGLEPGVNRRLRFGAKAL